MDSDMNKSLSIENWSEWRGDGTLFRCWKVFSRGLGVCVFVGRSRAEARNFKMNWPGSAKASAPIETNR